MDSNDDNEGGGQPPPNIVDPLSIERAEQDKELQLEEGADPEDDVDATIDSDSDDEDDGKPSPTVADPLAIERAEQDNELELEEADDPEADVDATGAVVVPVAKRSKHYKMLPDAFDMDRSLVGCSLNFEKRFKGTFRFGESHYGSLGRPLYGIPPLGAGLGFYDHIGSKFERDDSPNDSDYNHNLVQGIISVAKGSTECSKTTLENLKYLVNAWMATEFRFRQRAAGNPNHRLGKAKVGGDATLKFLIRDSQKETARLAIENCEDVQSGIEESVTDA